MLDINVLQCFTKPLEFNVILTFFKVKRKINVKKLFALFIVLKKIRKITLNVKKRHFVWRLRITLFSILLVNITVYIAKDNLQT